MRTLCVGEALVDLVCHKPVASIADADAFVPHFGGATANVAVGAARAGAHVALAGGAGDDAWGDWLRARLESEGVDLEFFRLVAGSPTPVAFVTVDADGTPSFQVYGDSIAAAVTAAGPHLVEAVERCGALFFGSNTLVGEDERALTMQVRERALQLGLPVVVDPNLRLHRWHLASHAQETTLEALRGAFLVKCNAAEATVLTGERDPAAAAQGLLAAGARHVVVTLGPHGALLRGGRLDTEVPGVRADAVDTTGAGDAFMGLMLARLSASAYYPPSISAALSDCVALASRATEHWGAL